MLAHRAKVELARLEVDDKLKQTVLHIAQVLDMCDSGPWVLAMVSRLYRDKPLTDLQGTQDEWVQLTEDVFVNSRCGSVFKTNGFAYHIAEPTKQITFPYKVL